MAAAENLMNDLETETDDDRPIHQRLFSVQEEPCIMPLPPENLNENDAGAGIDKQQISGEEKATEEKEDIEPEKTAEKPAENDPEELKGEETV